MEGNNRSRQFPTKLNTTTIVKMLILHFLISKNCYGNELIDLIEKSLNYKWRPSPGMIYPLLRSMEEDLLVDAWWDEPDKKTKRNYRITDIGITHYNRVVTINKAMLEDSLSIIECTIKTIYNK